MRAIKEAESLPCIVEEADMLSSVLTKFTEWHTAAEGLLEGYLMGSITLSQFTPAQQALHPSALDTQHLGSELCPKSNQKAQQEAAAPAEEAALLEADEAGAKGRVLTPANAAEPSLRGAEQPYRSSIDLHRSSSAAYEHETSQRTDSSSRRQSGDKAAEAVEQASLPKLEQLEQSRANGHIKQDEAASAELSPGDSLQGGAHDQPEGDTARGYLTMKTLKQLLKSALSIELDVGDLPDRLLHALKLQQWRFRASAALSTNTKYTGE